MTKPTEIDFFYARPGCESCEKVRAELVRRGTTIRAERSTKQPLSAGDAAELLRTVSEVTLLRGRSSRRRRADELTAADLLGPTGRIRAPLLRCGRHLLVGFETASLKEWLNRT
ncbi:MAG: hypothetical protein AB7G12_16530 [Thermoanaerobaculia bacterium]